MKAKLIVALALLLACSVQAAKDKVYEVGTVSVSEYYNGNFTDSTYCAEKPFGGFNCSGGITEDTTKYYALQLADHTKVQLHHSGAFNTDVIKLSNVRGFCLATCQVQYRMERHGRTADVFIRMSNDKESKYTVQFGEAVL